MAHIYNEDSTKILKSRRFTLNIIKYFDNELPHFYDETTKKNKKITKKIK